MILKRYDKNNLAQVILIMSFPFAYLLPIIVGLFQMKKYNYMSLKDERTKNYIRVWTQIEVFYFFVYILSLHLFMFFAYLRKFKSITRRRADEAQA
jgi:hypothetical protein